MLKDLILETFREMGIIDSGTTIELDEDLLESYLIDSLTFIEFIVNLEGKFGIELDEEDILVENFRSLSIIIEMIERYHPSVCVRP